MKSIATLILTFSLLLTGSTFGSDKTKNGKDTSALSPTLDQQKTAKEAQLTTEKQQLAEIKSKFTQAVSNNASQAELESISKTIQQQESKVKKEETTLQSINKKIESNQKQQTKKQQEQLESTYQQTLKKETTLKKEQASRSENLKNAQDHLMLKNTEVTETQQSVTKSKNDLAEIQSQLSNPELDSKQRTQLLDQKQKLEINLQKNELTLKRQQADAETIQKNISAETSNLEIVKNDMASVVAEKTDLEKKLNLTKTNNQLVTTPTSKPTDPLAVEKEVTKMDTNTSQKSFDGTPYNTNNSAVFTDNRKIELESKDLKNIPIIKSTGNEEQKENIKAAEAVVTDSSIQNGKEINLPESPSSIIWNSNPLNLPKEVTTKTTATASTEKPKPTGFQVPGCSLDELRRPSSYQKDLPVILNAYYTGKAKVGEQTVTNKKNDANFVIQQAQTIVKNEYCREIALHVLSQPACKKWSNAACVDLRQQAFLKSSTRVSQAIKHATIEKNKANASVNVIAYSQMEKLEGVKNGKWTPHPVLKEIAQDLGKNFTYSYQPVSSSSSSNKVQLDQTEINRIHRNQEGANVK